jgi:type II secretory pathway component GspD/PulD (secretin)
VLPPAPIEKLPMRTIEPGQGHRHVPPTTATVVRSNVPASDQIPFGNPAPLPQMTPVFFPSSNPTARTVAAPTATGATQPVYTAGPVQNGGTGPLPTAIVTPAARAVAPLSSRPSAMPVQPVIPDFDPEPFLQEEQNMVAIITNSALEDEIILELKYDDLELLDLIRSLSLQADLNVLFDPSLATPTTPDGQPAAPPPIVPSFRMSNVTAKQALDAILANYGLEMVYDIKTNTYRVQKKDAAAPVPPITRIVTLKFSNPTNLIEVLTAVVRTPGGVTAYQRTQQLIITASESEWEMVNLVLDQLDTPIKQVLIEANILETSRNPRSLRGIDWTGTLAGQNFGFGNGVTTGTINQDRPGATTTTTATLPSGRVIQSSKTDARIITESLSTAVGAGISASTRSGLNPSVAFLSADGVRGVLSYLNTDSDTEVIATPRAVMMDGETARLEVTRAFPIFEITPGSAQSPAGARVTYTNLGTILEVTPRVAANNNIVLRVIPEVSNIDGTDSKTINGTLNEANIYAIRKIETNVRIPSGHTLVMGGLINDTKTQGSTKVPFLGDIPILGWAFRRESKVASKQNLLIFVTPTIIEENHFQAPQTDFLHGVNTPTADDFLSQQVPMTQEKKEHFMDSAKPYDWNRKKDANSQKKKSWFRGDENRTKRSQ